MAVAARVVGDAVAALCRNPHSDRATPRSAVCLTRALARATPRSAARLGPGHPAKMALSESAAYTEQREPTGRCERLVRCRGVVIWVAMDHAMQSRNAEASSRKPSTYKTMSG